MAKNRYSVRMTYADGTPGLSLHPTLTAAKKAAQEPMHGGLRVTLAEVCERLSNGAELTDSRSRADPGVAGDVPTVLGAPTRACCRVGAFGTTVSLDDPEPVT